MAACQFAMQLSRSDWNWEQTCSLPELIKTPPWLDGQIIPAGLVLLLTCEQGRARVKICPRRGRARKAHERKPLRALRSLRAQLEKCCWTWAMRATRGERSVQRRWMHVEAQLQIHSHFLEESLHWQRKGARGREELQENRNSLRELREYSLQFSKHKGRIVERRKRRLFLVRICSGRENECQRWEPAQVHQQRRAPRPDAALRPISLRVWRWPWCWKSRPVPAHAGHRLSLRTDREVQRKRRGANERRRGRLRLAGVPEEGLIVCGRQARGAPRQEVQGAALPAAQHQRPGEEEDARSERRAGRPALCNPLRPQPLGEKTLQNSHSPPGQELHPHAGSGSGRDEAAGGVSEPGTDHNFTNPHRAGALWTGCSLPVLGLRTRHLCREVHYLFRDTVESLQTL